MNAYKNLNLESQKNVEEMVREEVHDNPIYESDKCTVTLTLDSGSKIIDDCFENALLTHECTTGIIVKAQVTLICGGVNVELVVPTSVTNKALRIVALPESSESASETFTKMRLWAEEYKPDWLRVVNGLPFILVWLLACLIALGFILLAMIVNSLSAGPTWREQAKELLKKEITPENQGDALKLLLRRELLLFGVEDTEAPIWLVAVLATLGIIALHLLVPITTAFESGKGKFSIKWQKLYSDYIRKSIPAYIFMGLGASLLASYIFEYFKNR